MQGKKLNDSEALQNRIIEVEQKIKASEIIIKEQVQEVKETLQPKVLFRNTFSRLAQTPEIQKTLLNTAIGFVLGYASKKSLEMLSEESLSKTAENFVRHKITQLEQKNTDSLFSKGITLVRKFTPSTSPLYSFVKY